MNTYSINHKERIAALGIMRILSVLIILSFHKYLPSGISVSSVLALFSGIVFIFDKWAWKWGFSQSICIETPNLNGSLVMTSTSSLKGPNDVYEAVLTIKQTWTYIFLFENGLGEK